MQRTVNLIYMNFPCLQNLCRPVLVKATCTVSGFLQMHFPFMKPEREERIKLKAVERGGSNSSVLLVISIWKSWHIVEFFFFKSEMFSTPEDVLKHTFVLFTVCD